MFSLKIDHLHFLIQYSYSNGVKFISAQSGPLSKKSGIRFDLFWLRFAASESKSFFIEGKISKQTPGATQSVV